jgi:tetratricopeptide (TPR) repeat protein
VILLTLGILAVLPSLTNAQTRLVNIEVEFAKGELAYARKDYQGSINHFKNLVRDDPQNARAHYWLGASYFASGEKQLAQAEFEKVIEIGQPQDFVRKAKRYLSAITGQGEQTKWWEINLLTGVRYDSNLFLDSDVLNLRADQSAAAWDAMVRGVLYPVRLDRFLLGMEYTYFNAFYHEHTGFSFMAHRAGLILKSDWDRLSLLFRPNFSATFVDKGQDRYQILGQFPLTTRFKWSDVAAAEFTYRFELENFNPVGNATFAIPNADLRDNWAMFSGLSQFLYFLEGRGSLNLGFEWAYENATNPFDLYGPKFFGTLGLPLPLEFLFEIYGSYAIKFYFNDQYADIGYVPNFNKRRDDVITVGTRIKRQIYGPVWGSAAYEYLNNDSNEIALNYQKHMTNFYLGVDF